MNINKIIIALLVCAGVSSLTQCAAQRLKIEKQEAQLPPLPLKAHQPLPLKTHQPAVSNVLRMDIGHSQKQGERFILSNTLRPFMDEKYKQRQKELTGPAFITNKTNNTVRVEYQDITKNEIKEVTIKPNERKLLLPIKDLGMVLFKTEQGAAMILGGQFGTYKWYEDFFREHLFCDGLNIVLGTKMEKMEKSDLFKVQKIKPSIEIICNEPMPLLSKDTHEK